MIPMRLSLTQRRFPLELSMPNRNSPNSSDLKNMGLKATLPRLKVLEIFQRSSVEGGGRHMSAEDVYKALMAENIDVGLATVYRTLDLLVSSGLVAERDFGEGFRRYEPVAPG